MKYRRAGREQVVTLGRFPAMSLPEARAARDAARSGWPPASSPHCRAGRVEISTFAQLARAWHAHQAPRWSIAHAADVLASLERDVFPALGEQPISAIDAPALLPVLEEVEGRGCLATAKRVRQRLSGIFRYGIARRLCDADPAAIVAGALCPRGHRASIPPCS
jgi:integrase